MEFSYELSELVFSPNPGLLSATRRPSIFSSWSHWDRLSSKQKSTLASLAGFHYTASNVKRTNTHLKLLKHAHGLWEWDLYSVFWSGNGYDKTYLCNVFVGDAIYLYNQQNFIAGNGHYYDPRQILNGRSFLKKRASYTDVQIGDIVVIGTGHVEIITRIEKNLVFDDGFCSIGAGRGERGEDGDGKVRCDSSNYFKETRELKNPNNTYFYL